MSHQVQRSWQPVSRTRVQGRPLKRDSPQMAGYISFTKSMGALAGLSVARQPQLPPAVGTGAGPIPGDDELRMIIHEPRPHNAGRARGLRHAPILVAAAALLLAASGCGGKAETPAGGTALGDARTAAPCPLVVDDSGWQAFEAIAARATAGGPLGEDELAALGDLPSFTAWRASMDPNVPPAMRVGNWVEDAFWDELGRTGDRKVNADRRAIAGSYRWSWDHRARIDSLAARLMAPGAACGVLTLCQGWIEPDSLPASPVLYLLPGKPELRYHEGNLFVDTGVLAAGSPAQLERQLAGLLYRNVGATPGPSPLESTGAAAIGHTFRIIRNEGIAAWIEQLPDTHFDPEHPRLRRVTPVPEHFYQTTLRTLEVMLELLPATLADPAALEQGGEPFARTIAAGGGLNQGGYGMAALIQGRLGEARLKEAARTVPGFVAAYQEAALMGPAERPALGAQGHEPWESLGPIDPAVFAQLMPVLASVFPAGS